jgi:hypothetical protein
MLDLHSASQIVDAALPQARQEGLAPMTVASESPHNELGQARINRCCGARKVALPSPSQTE